MNKMEQIPYLDILKNAWKITWRHKVLWWFGLLVTFGSGSASFNYSFGGSQEKEFNQESLVAVGQWIGNNAGLVMSGIIAIAVLFFLVFSLAVIGKGALIRCVYLIDGGKTVTFKQGFRFGISYFWKLIGLGFLVGLAVFTGLLIIVSPVVIAAFQQAPLIAILLGVLGVGVFIVLALVAVFVKRFAQLYLVTSGIGVFDALEQACVLFRRNILPSALMTLIILPIQIALFFIILLSVLFMAVPFLLLGTILYFLLGTAGAIGTAVMALALLVVMSMLMGAVFQTFHQTAWYLFFKHIASWVDTELKEAEKADEVLKRNAPVSERCV